MFIFHEHHVIIVKCVNMYVNSPKYFLIPHIERGTINSYIEVIIMVFILYYAGRAYRC